MPFREKKKKYEFFWESSIYTEVKVEKIGKLSSSRLAKKHETEQPDEKECEYENKR